jgi:hypothetical protein
MAPNIEITREQFVVTRRPTEFVVTREQKVYQVVIQRGVHVNNIIADDTTYAHSQPVAATTWVINHNLNKYPSVTVIDSAGEFHITNITYINANTLHLIFAAAIGGTAYIN